MSVRETPLRAFMFWPGHHRSLYSEARYDIAEQLDGVLELLEICNSYVLNDVTALGGHPVVRSEDEDEWTQFTQAEAASRGGIETIGYTQGEHHNLLPIHQALKIPNAVAEADRAYNESPWGSTHKRLMDAANILQAQSYLLLADRNEAIYVPERMYGHQALERYAQVPGLSTHAMENKFRERIGAELADYYRGRPALQVHVPCFLSEVLRNSGTRDGIAASLRQLRDSAAARHYRDLARVMATKGGSYAEWKKAGRELQQLSEAAFTGEGLKTRVPAWLKTTVGLSSGAIGVLFPEVAAAGAAMKGTLEIFEHADRWFRRRTNIFELYASAAMVDLHAELKRLFPEIGFGAPHLKHFLTTRNFGWSKEDDLLLFMDA